MQKREERADKIPNNFFLEDESARSCQKSILLIQLFYRVAATSEERLTSWFRFRSTERREKSKFVAGETSWMTGHELDCILSDDYSILTYWICSMSFKSVG